MATVTSFEELDVWQRARELARGVYAATRKEPFASDHALCNQIRRSVISIPSNIAEGFERGGRPEFIQFLSIAKGSSGELKTQLHIAHDQGYLSDEAFESLRRETTETANMIGGFIRYLAQSEIRGSKFKRTGSDRPRDKSGSKSRDA